MNFHVSTPLPSDPTLVCSIVTAKNLLDQGAIEEAISYLTTCAQAAPLTPEAHNLLGNAYILQAKIDDALGHYERASAMDPSSIEFLLNIANAEQLRGHLAIAREKTELALRKDGNSIEALYRLALLDMSEGNLKSASLSLDTILEKDANFAPALLQRSILKLKNANTTAAFVDVNKSIEVDPNNSYAYLIRGLLFLDHQLIEAAELDFEQAEKLGLTHTELENGKAIIAYKRKDYQSAKRKFLTLFQKEKQDINYLFNIGSVYLEEKNTLKASLYFRKILKHESSHLNARNSLANCYRLQEQFDAAINEYQKILEIDPINEIAMFNIAGAYLELKGYDVAIEYAEKAIYIAPQRVEYQLLKARIYFEKNEYEKAQEIYENITKNNDKIGEAFLYLGHIHRINRNLDKTIYYYEKAFENDLQNIYLESDLLFSKLQVCDWTNFHDSWNKISKQIDSGNALASPFFMVAVSNNPEQQRRLATAYSKDQIRLKDELDPIEKYQNHKRIRIGYYSADFNNHATMHLMAGLFEAHDREHFELFAFSFGPKIIDEMRMRAETAFDHFIDVTDFTDRAVALISRHYEIDIAVDIKGYTAHSRPGIFAYRAAPIQINYLGFPGTMGAEFIDYIIADPIIIPESYDKYYSEKVLRLPMSYQVNDQTRPPIERAFTKAEAGLPEDKFIFSSFNTNYKILPETLDSWARILKNVPNSVIWILADNETAKKNLLREFTLRSIKHDRIIFADRADPKFNLARQDCANLFLDTFPCTAHTTASDAVFSGVPLLTLNGETFASRVASSVLYAVGLPDLVTQTRADYEAKAIYLGNNPLECERMAKYLKSTIRLTPLFDTVTTARELENLYKGVLL